MKTPIGVYKANLPWTAKQTRIKPVTRLHEVPTMDKKADYERQLNYKKRMKLKGYMPVEVLAHQDDRQRVIEYAAKLRKKRAA